VICEQDDICKSLLLVSRSERQEIDLINELMKYKNQNIEIKHSTNLAEIKNADVIVVCTNTNDPIVFKHHISRDKPVLISDLSVPSAVSEEVRHLPNVTVLPFAAYVCLPEDGNVVISSYSPPGTVFCCAGEAILLALESCDQPLKGKISPEAVKSITRLGSKYGFFDTIDSMTSYKTINC
jgi:predicted amino acid dehydrogenase